MTKLQTYRDKRRFDQTPEPSGSIAPSSRRKRSVKLTFVVQKHAASRLHYDFRLELGGVLKSWAVPKGPSYDPHDKSLAVHVEDHPLEYATFEGVIPKGQYGGGTVMLWDRGTWEPIGDPKAGYEKGVLKFYLSGEKLRGKWQLIRLSGHRDDGDDRNWLLIKKDDDFVQSADDYDVREERPESVASGRTLDQIARDRDRVWNSGSEQRREDDARSEHSVDVLREQDWHPSQLDGARIAKLPLAFDPQLATSCKSPPRGDQWLHEIKYDGYRLLARVDAGQTQLLTRRGHDWTDRFPKIARRVQQLATDGTIVDGEVVVMADDGTTDFQALQNAMRGDAPAQLVYYVFDLPFFDGYDLRRAPLSERKRCLRAVIESSDDDLIRYSDHIVGSGAEMMRHACRHALEGLISKRAESLYVSARSRDWVKAKCLRRQEFVVGGWSEPSGSRVGFGALLLGVYDQGRLRYCGRVGTGFDRQSLETITSELERLNRRSPPFAEPPWGTDAKGVHWVEPKLVAEVEFTQWTHEGLLRHPSFQGLREDKDPREVRREQAETQQEIDAASDTPHRSSGMAPKRRPQPRPKTPGPNRSAAVVSDVTLSNPQRILYADQGITKQDLAEYYVKVADHILPHLIGRPVTLVRCPQGQQAKCFYQKHLTDLMPSAVRGVSIAQGGQDSNYVVIDDLQGLISLIQMNVLELHPWPAREDKLERPDRLIFDLDPGPETDGFLMVQAARDVRRELEHYDLQSFVRTSGGKGLHVVIPIDRRNSWDDLKSFAKRVAHDLSERHPQRYVATMRKAERRGRIFIDYLRNGRGATAVASFSTRARPGAPVCTPLRWDELTPQLSADRYTIQNLPRRLAALRQDPWDGFFDVRQRLPTTAIKGR